MNWLNELRMFASNGVATEYERVRSAPDLKTELRHAGRMQGFADMSFYLDHCPPDIARGDLAAHLTRKRGRVLEELVGFDSVGKRERVMGRISVYDEVLQRLQGAIATAIG